MSLRSLISKTKKMDAEDILALSPYKDCSKITDAIDSCSVVSFDIFDTLLKRDVDCPERIFDLVEAAFNKEGKDKIISFRDARVCAERDARREQSFGTEISLDSIYEKMPFSDDQKKRLLKLEIEAEHVFSCSAAGMKRIFDWALKHGKRIVLVSDMYLPESVIRELLEKSGYPEVPLYLSSTWGSMKKDGGLFKVMLREESLNPSEVIHIGDNPRSDYLMPRKLGMASLLIKRRPLVISHRLSVAKETEGAEGKGAAMASHILDAIAENHACHLDDYYERFGWNVFGPLLYKLTLFVRQVYRDERADKIFFLARDGYIVQKAFNALFEDDAGAKSSYLYASRRAFGVPSISSYEDFLEIMPGNKSVTFGELLEAVGIQKIKLPEGARRDDRIREYKSVKPQAYYSFLKTLYEQVVAGAEAERKNMAAYFEQEQVNGHVLLFDIGWAGSIQYYFDKLIREFNIDAQSTGVYLGCLPDKMREGISYRSLLRYKPEAYFGLLESLFFAPEGSCWSIGIGDDGVAQPKLSPYEYENGGLIDEGKAIARIQHGALAFVSRMREMLDFASLDYSKTVAMARMESVGMSPAATDLRHLGDIRYFTNGNIDYLARPKSIWSYLKSPNSFKGNFTNSRWKTGFVKSLFKLPLPYGILYGFLTKCRD